MSHFMRDIIRIGPAPTMAREIPVTIANALFSVLAVVVIYALHGGVSTAMIVFAVVLGLYTVARPVIVAVRGDRTPQRV